MHVAGDEGLSVATDDSGTATVTNALASIGISSPPPPVEHLLILDFEATCENTEDGLTRLEQCTRHEIIEFPVLWVDAHTGVLGVRMREWMVVDDFCGHFPALCVAV